MIMGVDTDVLRYQIPGDDLNLASQLAEQKASICLPQVLEEVPRGPRRSGLPTAGHTEQPDCGDPGRRQRAPGERYKMVSTELKITCAGFMGAGEHQRHHSAAGAGDEKPVTVRPADLLELSAAAHRRSPTIWSRRRTCSPISCSPMWRWIFQEAPRAASSAVCQHPRGEHG